MSSNINIKFGQKIKKIRQKRGVTQEELAELTKTSYKYIQRMEGRSPPDIRLSTIERRSTALQIKPFKLFERL